MTQVFNPVDVEQAIRQVSTQISKNVLFADQEYRKFLTADHLYDLAFARAYMAHKGPAHEKRYAAELATEQERSDRDVAEAAYRYADRQAKALDAELRSWQSVGASVRSMFTGAGV
ncbi:MAG: hypothetical protein ABW022_07235 [Actinoplanes sp.]